jgi:hypothetical protein
MDDTAHNIKHNRKQKKKGFRRRTRLRKIDVPGWGDEGVARYCGGVVLRRWVEREREIGRLMMICCMG